MFVKISWLIIKFYIYLVKFLKKYVNYSCKKLAIILQVFFNKVFIGLLMNYLFSIIIEIYIYNFLCVPFFFEHIVYNFNNKVNYCFGWCDCFSLYNEDAIQIWFLIKINVSINYNIASLIVTFVLLIITFASINYSINYSICFN